MNRLSVNTSNANTPSTNHQSAISCERERLVKAEASNAAHLQLQAWKGYLLLSIIFGTFILVPLNATGELRPLETSVSSMVRDRVSLNR